MAKRTVKVTKRKAAPKATERPFTKVEWRIAETTYTKIVKRYYPECPQWNDGDCLQETKIKWLRTVRVIRAILKGGA